MTVIVLLLIVLEAWQPCSLMVWKISSWVWIGKTWEWANYDSILFLGGKISLKWLL